MGGGGSSFVNAGLDEAQVYEIDRKRRSNRCSGISNWDIWAQGPIER